MDIAAIILSGGKSSRFGEDKGLFKFKGQSLVEYAIQHCEKFTKNITIVSNREEYLQFSFSIYDDIYKNCGPMGGIHSGLLHSLNDINLIISNDTPFIDSKLVQTLIDEYNNEDVLIFQSYDGKYQTLLGIYHKRIIKKLEIEIQKNHLKMIRFIKQTNHRIIKLPSDDSYNKSFININYLKEVEKYES